MAPTSTTWTRWLAALAILFAVLNGVNALNKGGDAAVFFEGGRRFLQAEPLYEGSSAADGFIGPPFQALFFAPFAAVASVHPVAAKLLWHVVNVACLALGVWLAARAWEAARDEWPLPRVPRLPMLFAPLAAILLPLQTNFEHQNMNAVLLAILAGATWQLTLGSAAIAGVLIGFASALKIFPALFIAYLALRRYWTAAIAAVATALVLSILPVAVYGASGFAEHVTTFARLSNSGWPVRVNNQSLIAVLDRWLLEGGGIGADLQGVHVMSEAIPAVVAYWIGVLLLVSMMLSAVVDIPRRRAKVPLEMAAVTPLAVLLSPIAWDHYWTLMFGSFLIVYAAHDARHYGNGMRYAFWGAALLTSGLSPLTLGSSGFNAARSLGSYAVAALIVFAAAVALCRRIGRRDSHDGAISD